MKPLENLLKKSEPGSTQFKKMQFAERAMKNLQLKEMEIQLLQRIPKDAPLPAKASIRGTYEEKNSKINLNLDLNLRGEVEKIIRNAAKGELDLIFLKLNLSPDPPSTLY